MMTVHHIVDTGIERPASVQRSISSLMLEVVRAESVFTTSTPVSRRTAFQAIRRPRSESKREASPTESVTGMGDGSVSAWPGDESLNAGCEGAGSGPVMLAAPYTSISEPAAQMTIPTEL